MLAEVWAGLALIFGLFSVYKAWELWDSTQAVTRLQGYNSTFYVANPYSLSSSDAFFAYLGVGLLVLQALLLLVAFSPLREHTTKGWELSFLVGLASICYAVVALFIRDQGLSVFLWRLVVTALGFYLLFQIQSRFRKTPVKKSKKA